MLQPSLAPGASPFTIIGHPFSRSYGAILPSSLTWFISRTLGYSPRLPVSVYGTDVLLSTLRSFSWQHSINESRLYKVLTVLTTLELYGRRICLPTTLQPSPAVFPPKRKIHPDGSPNILRPSIAPAKRYRNINLLSIDYAFRPRLRPD